jgi:hypothetical protein
LQAQVAAGAISPHASEIDRATAALHASTAAMLDQQKVSTSPAAACATWAWRPWKARARSKDLQYGLAGVVNNVPGSARFCRESTQP